MIFAYVLPIERPKTVKNGTEKAIIFLAAYGHPMVAGRSVFVLPPFQYQSGAQGKLDSASVWREETV
jgi:hypothetical protein